MTLSNTGWQIKNFRAGAGGSASASLYFEGRKVANCRDAGGLDSIQFDWIEDMSEEFDVYVATIPMLDMFGEVTVHCADTYVMEFIDDRLKRMEIGRLCSNFTVYEVSGDGIRVAEEKYTERMDKWLRETHGDKLLKVFNKRLVK